MFKVKMKNYYQKEYEDVENSASTDIRHLWKYVKGKRESCVTPIVHDDKLYNTPDELCELWHGYYHNLLNEQPSETDNYDGLLLTYGLATRHACYAPATRPLLAVDFSQENPIIAH